MSESYKDLALPLEAKGNPNYVNNLKRRNRIRLAWRLLLPLAFCFVLWHRFYVAPCITTNSVEPGIHWYSCDDHIECGGLSVPLDYADLSLDARNASLSVARYPATNKKERIGTLLLNPGGPGGSGVSLVYAIGSLLDVILDGRYDIVSWDPRGMNETKPRITCFPSKTAQDVFYANTEQAIPFRNLSDPIDLEAWVAQIRLADAKNSVLAELCHEQSQDTLNHVGTPTVARDMERLFRVLEGDDEPVNYWGFSYGSILGSYFVNMFPDRVGRVIIDGVINPVVWSSQPTYLYPNTLYTDIERDLEDFYTACANAGPDRCALASNGSTPRSVLNTIDKLLLDLYERPLPVIEAARPGIFTQGGINQILFSLLYNPRSWTASADVLSAVRKGNVSSIWGSFQPPLELHTNVQDNPVPTVLWTSVTCFDAPPLDLSSKSDVLQLAIDESVKNFETISPHFGAMGTGLPISLCHHWKGKAAERFPGPFNHTLSNKILVVGNTADPVTPLVGAKAVNSLLHHSSRLIIQDGNGHCSIAQVSLCTIAAIKAYLLRGELPENGIVCPVNERPFPPPTTGAGTPSLEWLIDEEGKFSEEDVRLLEIWKGIGQRMEAFIGTPKNL